MKPFLKQVAEHYCAAGGLEHCCFIFPNRRAEVFFKKYLAEEVARAGAPTMSPGMYTMNDFVARASGVRIADRMCLLLELYKCYCRLNPEHETLDDFIFWGDVLLGDFNDVDKYLVDARILFTNVSDLRRLQGGLDYLDEKQEEAIRRFAKHFIYRDNDGRTEYKERFRRIWDILLPLYCSFNEALSSSGVAYEGAAYRRLAERLSGEAAVDILAADFRAGQKFVFVGLNALNECEKRLMSKMRDAHVAEFCWDFCSAMLRDRDNKSSLFMAENVREFPQAFELEAAPGTPKFHLLGIPSAVGQAKQLPKILDSLGASGIETAVVLPDEAMLVPVLNSIPERIHDINVTMGYPMKESGLWALMSSIASLQMHLRQREGRWFFYYRQVYAIFSNGLVKSILSEEGNAVVAKVRKDAKYYVPEEDLRGDEVLEMIFRPVVSDVKDASAEQISRIAAYQETILSGMAPKLKTVGDMALEIDFAGAYYRALSRLAGFGMAVLPATWFRLLDKMVGSAAVPFKGEPLKGLQIMGPLETRALDFDKLVILNCNEKIFPRRSVSSSFIPAELRRGFGLPTYEYQDAVWAYYFYRMIQRASDVWMLVDSRAGGPKSGEESRYVKQLEMHFGQKVERVIAASPIDVPGVAPYIVKTEEDVAAIRKNPLSATSLQNYLSCPAKFYYAFVKGIREPDEVSDSLDRGEFGTVLHSVMQRLYSTPDGKVDDAQLGRMLEGDRIRSLVQEFIKEKLKTIEISGRNLVHEESIVKSVRLMIEKDRDLLETSPLGYFRILGLECKKMIDFEGFKIKGIIDRIDSIEDGKVRVVDYKTGRVLDKDIRINDGNAEEVVKALFGTEDSKRPKIALQLYLYDRLVHSDQRFKDMEIVNSVYSTMRFQRNGVENFPASNGFIECMDERLSGLLKEIVDTSVPFERRVLSGEQGHCNYCCFKKLCNL